MKKKIVLITGCLGLVGYETCKFFAKKNFLIVGIDNDQRKYFFGKEGSNLNKLYILQKEIKKFKYYNTDIRSYKNLTRIFSKYKKQIQCIVHCAAQPSHDWAAREPLTDFNINSLGTLNLLELTRLNCIKASFIYVSTNKVYGDNPNNLPLIEKKNRYEVSKRHSYYKKGIDENMSIDKTMHSLFGVSKLAGDLLAQEYGKYFNLKTGIFRASCITGPAHSGTELHGFLNYLTKMCIEKKFYKVIGYKGKQVRDNIHSYDLVNMFWNFYKKPLSGEVFNVGGGVNSNCSVIEGIKYCEKKLKIKIKLKFIHNARKGDHIWYISNISKFKKFYPKYKYKYNMKKILDELIYFYLNKRNKLKILNKNLI